MEDEESLRENITSYLNDDGNVCENSSDLATAFAKLEDYDYDCVLLDIGLPDGEGFEILKMLRKERRQEAVLIISAKNSIEEKVFGLNIGADDYITKPFHLAELKARIDAIFRRKNSNGNNKLIFKDIVVDLQSRDVIVNEKAIILTRKEYEMLLYFIANKGKVISKNAIAIHLWGDEMDMLDNFHFLYTHIKNLRKKIADVSANEYLVSIYGIGYKFISE